MRTTKDLIDELKTASRGGRPASLIVAFAKETKFVHSNDEGALETLNAMVKAGGQPMGFALVRQKKGELTVTLRPLAEHRGDEFVRNHLTELSGSIQLAGVGLSLKSLKCPPSGDMKNKDLKATPNERWQVGLCITPFKIWGFPARKRLAFGEALWDSVESLKAALAKSQFAVKTEFDGGFPKLLIDAWGFSLRLKRGSRGITDQASASETLSPDDFQVLTQLCNALKKDVLGT